ncbi:piggyBac transposable element-derived protein 4-like [Argopecten irradians]|uniref:piggyBac transposable element-derived protein 4-like n=1 Tax=Argopecten irradians TaxID=31199 RepID=UPI003720E280
MAAAFDSDWDSDEDDNIENIFNENSDSEPDFEGFGPEDIVRNGAVIAHIDMDDFSPENDDEDNSDKAEGWTKSSGPPLCAPFTGESKLNVNMENQEPIDFFQLFLNDDFLNIVVQQTNLYADRKKNQGRQGNHSRISKWKPVSLEEIKVFFGLVIAMGLVHKSDIDTYWATEDVIFTPFFGDKMSKDRFQNILSNLHLCDNDTFIPPGQPGYDPLHKIRPMIQQTLNAFIDVYSPAENLSFDEATCPWKGRLRFKVYNPAKPCKFGIKLYQVCEADSGYCVGYDVYVGKNNRATSVYCEELGLDEELSETTKTVIGLLARCGCLDKGHRVYLDNYYNSPELFDELEHMNTYACGTLRTNRKGVPVAIKRKNRKLLQGQCIFRQKDNLLVIKFHDKRDVHMLSNFHEPQVAVLNKTDPKTNTPITKPTCVVDYIKHMGGVDLSDQLNNYNSILRKTKKWWRKLFFHLVNVCIVNAYQLYKKFSPDVKKKSHFDFRLSTVRSLVEAGGVAARPAKRGRKVLGELPARLVGQHLPEYVPATPGAKRARPLRECKACNVKKKDRERTKRKQTSFQCNTCQVALCVPDCFKAFHTYVNYRQVLLPAANEDSD